MQNLSGQTIGRYHIIEKLGEGGMAVVYRAFDTTLDCSVAIKILRMDDLPPSSAERTLKRFKREAKETAQLMHPNIIQVTDYGEFEGAPFLVMPFVPGGTLKQKLQELQNPMPYQEAAKLLVPIARALESVHKSGVVHRDLKPGNILITRDGQPMLTDFGIAKILENDRRTTELTSAGSAIGTPEYMAPEQWMGRELDGRADIYSLGIVFYEMITGHTPFSADTVPAVMVMALRDPLPRPRDFVKGLPDFAEQVLYRALAREPENRYQEMGQFANDLERLAANYKGQNELHEKVDKKEQSKKWIYVSLGILAVLSIIGFYFLTGKNTDKSTITEQPAVVFDNEKTATKSQKEPEGTPTTVSTPTPSFTKTPIPTYVPIGTNVPVVNKILLDENFDELTNFEFQFRKKHNLTDGILFLEAPIVSADMQADEASKFISNFKIKQGNGYLLLFRSKPDAFFYITFEIGPFNDPSYRALWFDNGKAISIWRGTTQIFSRSINIKYQHDTWYYLIMWLNPDGVEGKIWEKDKPENNSYFKADTGEEWARSQMLYVVNVAQGIVEIDKFQELEFSK